MATVGTQLPTLADLATRAGGGPIFEVLSKVNEVLDDMPWMQCNDGTKHKTTYRTGIPQATLREINKGVPRVKTHTAMITETTAVLETYFEIDKLLVDIQKAYTDAEGAHVTREDAQTNYRASEATGIMEGMSQQMATLLWYGSASDPKSFVGMAPRYATLDPAKAASAENVIDGGGVGSTNTSAWLITWGERTTHGLYPEGVQSGLIHRDLGEDTLRDDDNNQFQGYRDNFQWHCGLSVRDWRYNARVANIDLAAIANDVDDLKALIRMFIEASEKLYTTGAGNSVWYVNRRLRTLFRIAILEKIGNNLTWETVAGKRMMMFDGYPVRMSEALLNTEARVTT